jgi:hypothetical protein
LKTFLEIEELRALVNNHNYQIPYSTILFSSFKDTSNFHVLFRIFKSISNIIFDMRFNFKSYRMDVLHMQESATSTFIVNPIVFSHMQTLELDRV